MRTVGSLFSGYGGLDRAVEAVFGAMTVWHSQYEPPTEKQPNPSQAPSKVLAAHWDAPNHGDIKRIDWALVEPVDIVAAGYPCQPDSLAGKGLSTDDDRYLWPEVARAISVLGPRLVVLENVFGHVVRGFAGVVGSLAELGYDAQWATVRASDVGAPHRRERLFVVAYPGSEHGVERRQPTPEQAAGGRPFSEFAGRGRASATHPDRARLEGDWPVAATQEFADADRVAGTATHTHSYAVRLESIAQSWRGGTAEPRETLPDTDCDGLEVIGGQFAQRCDPDGRSGSGVAWGDYEPAIRRWERILGRAAPNPTELNTKGGQRLAPRFVEWMMGLPAGWVTDVPDVSRNDQLKMLGNGVVPQQAMAALDALLGVVS